MMDSFLSWNLRNFEFYWISLVWLLLLMFPSLFVEKSWKLLLDWCFRGFDWLLMKEEELWS